jgi:two-component system alkaline phosphatase synthesis response regulator PhoP
MIWCVEDDASIRDIEVYALNSAGFEARGFEDGSSFYAAITGEKEKPQLIVLDVMLPGIDGIELLRRIRANAALKQIPIVMVTAKGSEYDRIQGLDLGADYYLTKPFGVMELISCVKAVLRRCGAEDEKSTLNACGISMNTLEHTVSADGERITLTYKEYELLKLFLSHMGTAFTREQLMEQVWGTDYMGETRTIDMHIRTLRQKLGKCGESIKTVRNVGYRMEEGQ